MNDTTVCRDCGRQLSRFREIAGDALCPNCSVEALAKAFHKDTGIMAPFKDAGMIVGMYSQEDRRAEYDKWAKKNDEIYV